MTFDCIRDSNCSKRGLLKNDLNHIEATIYLNFMIRHTHKVRLIKVHRAKTMMLPQVQDLTEAKGLTKLIIPQIVGFLPTPIEPRDRHLSDLKEYLIPII